MAKEDHTRLLKTWARELGFDHCGIAIARPLDEDARRLESWLKKGMHGSMHYMEKYFDLRIDPSRLVPGARSVITLLMNYFPAEKQTPGQPQIAKYAYGKDYHDVIRSRLQQLMALIRDRIGDVHGKGFVDSAPVLERAWAVRSGLGWIGRNGNLLRKGGGSFFFITTLITDLDLVYDDPFAGDLCGTCRRCIDACPTGAILDDKVVDGSRCISYFTIELKDNEIPDTFKGQFGNWMFGCDICQDVCPWNRFSTPATETGFAPLWAVLHLSTAEWEDLTEARFRALFRDSALKRAKYMGIRRNLQFIAHDQKTGDKKNT